MLNCRLHLSLRCIALFLLFNEFLNFARVHSRRALATVLNLTRLDHSLDLCFDIAIGQILLLQEKLWVLASE